LILYIHIVFVILLSVCYSQSSSIPINHLETEYYSIPLSLESHRKTIFLLNQNFPNITHDVEYLNFKIDGSMNYPLYNSIPKQVFINSSDTLTMSQLSFLQDHSEYFYDTSVALKSYLRKDINLLTQFESKSRKRYLYDANQGSKGVNYDQKAMVSIYKDNEISLIDAGYMYHYEKIPTYIKSEDYPTEPYFRSIESYNFKLCYEFFGDKIKIKNKSNFQLANSLRPLELETFNTVDSLEYLTETNWNQTNIDYIINKKYIFNIKSDYKFIKSDTADNMFLFNSHYHKSSLGFTLKHKLNELKLGINNFSGKNNYHYFDYVLNLNNFNFFLSAKNNVYMNMKYSDNKYFINKTLSKDQLIGFSFKNSVINTSLLAGYHDIQDYRYFYYRLNTSLTYKWVSAAFLYNVYDSNELFLKNYMGLSVKISPAIENKRYRPYAKIRFNNLSVNSMFKISQNQLNFYNQIVSGSSESGGVNITDIELGVVFNYFKIALIYENYYNMPFTYGYDFDSTEDSGDYFSIQNNSDYLVEITWIFKE